MLLKTNLQVPVLKTVKQKGDKVAKAKGFDSLQQVVRLFLHQFIQDQISIRIAPPNNRVEYLTVQEEDVLADKLRKFEREEKKGQVPTAHSAKELFEQLNVADG